MCIRKIFVYNLLSLPPVFFSDNLRVTHKTIREYFWNLCLYLAGEYFFILKEGKSDHSTADTRLLIGQEWSRDLDTGLWLVIHHSTADRMNSSSTWVDIF